MALGIKPLYEERKWEFLPDRTYCLKMIAEVVEYLPPMYAEAVGQLCKEYGREVDLTDIRNARSGRNNDRFIAYCINQYGKMHMK